MVATGKVPFVDKYSSVLVLSGVVDDSFIWLKRIIKVKRERSLAKNDYLLNRFAFTNNEDETNTRK